jgi:hypothetical protein
MKIIQTTVQALVLPALLIMSLAVTSTPTAAQNTTQYDWVLVNHTRTDFAELYLVPSGAATWGKKVKLEKDDGSLYAGESYTLHVAPGEYDIKLVTAKGGACLTRRVSVSKQLRWQMTDGWLQLCVAGSRR